MLHNKIKTINFKGFIFLKIWQKTSFKRHFFDGILLVFSASFDVQHQFQELKQVLQNGSDFEIMILYLTKKAP